MTMRSVAQRSSRPATAPRHRDRQPGPTPRQPGWQSGLAQAGFVGLARGALLADNSLGAHAVTHPHAPRCPHRPSLALVCLLAGCGASSPQNAAEVCAVPAGYQLLVDVGVAPTRQIDLL